MTYFLWDSKTNSKINYYENPKASIHVISSYSCNAYSNFKIWGILCLFNFLNLRNVTPIQLLKVEACNVTSIELLKFETCNAYITFKIWNMLHAYSTFKNWDMYYRIPLVRWSLHKYKCLWDVGSKGQGSSLQEGVSHTYTLRLG